MIELANTGKLINLLQSEALIFGFKKCTILPLNNIGYSIYYFRTVNVMDFDDQNPNIEDENLEEILEDIALTDDSENVCFAKRDNTIFIVDCETQIMAPLPGEKQSEFDKIMESYKNFMMTKIIANSSDRVGLIFYNVSNKHNALGIDNVFTVHNLQSPSAKMIQSVEKIKKDFMLNYGLSDQKVSLHQVLWLFGEQIKSCEPFKNHVRLFLFTTNDCPHPQTNQKRQQSINLSRQLAAKGVQIQLFPIRKDMNSRFDLRKFYEQIVTFDIDDLNKNLLDNSSKIMDLQTRIRQREFKKRTLNRLLMQVGEETYIGMQIYSTLAKARKPLCKKLEANTNRPLKRVIKRLNNNGQVLYNEQIGTFYPLSDERIRLTKQDVNKIKSLRKPGITLIGFKPKKLIKPYHNLRPSYFLYPDQEHVTGSCQFVDALIEELVETEQIAIVSIMPRMNQQLRFAALFPQRESYDIEDHHQTPPGFHMVWLPYSDDIVNFAGGEKTIVKPSKVSMELIKLTKLLINNLTVTDFDFRDFQNPSIQKFYAHLQAHALNQQVVEEKEDTIQPDYEGFDKYSDIFKMIQETADAQTQEQNPFEDRKIKRTNSKKEEKKEEQDHQNLTDNKKSKRRNDKSKDKQTDHQQPEPVEKKRTGKKDTKKQTKQEDNTALFNKVQNQIEDGNARILTNNELVEYLKLKKLNSNGNKSQLVDRIMLYISYSL